MKRMSMVMLCALASLSCVGCGADWQSETHPARGRITVNGQPAAGALVQFHAVEKTDVRNSRPWGVVQGDGSFTLTTYEPNDGAPAGEYVLTLTWPWDVSKPSPEDRLHYAYARPEQSAWRVTVAPGENALPPVEIRGARVAQKPGAGLSSQAARPFMPGGMARR